MVPLGGPLAAGGNKFGTFGGVFTPSILTILGVIMYLRLPRIVGEGGLYLAIGIIIAAHVISVTTGLSVSSIATDKRVEAGGAYYIVSRSMGLAIGGTLGIALFVGLSFSISLYIIGFSESFLAYYSLPADVATIRICGTITLIVLTVITFVSTSLAIRAQYVILLMIVASLGSIFFGTVEAPPEPLLLPQPDAQATLLFGIFFPAVTGFTAGVNMSGDLRDPRRSIPLGTVAAIAVGMVVYISLAVFLAYRIPVAGLVENSSILVDVAWSPWLVVGGIWGATISSALGSILGAPRILQALSLDHITPRLFGIGQGESNEPRYALFLAFVIGEAGILIGELDAIARIVSVFFIATYGFLNLSASFEMIASPDFRPEFRIPRWVPVLGAITCAILMIWLDLLAMLGAVIVLSGLFFVIKRRELQLETGDTLLGVWSSVVRLGLHRLTRESQHQRNWLPNILVFTEREARSRQALLEFGHSLIRHRGVATEFLVQEEGRAAGVGRTPFHEGDSEQQARLGPFLGEQAGFFHREVGARRGDPYPTMDAVCRFHGISGLEPNTVVLDWHAHAHRPEGFADFLVRVADLDFNVMGIAYDPELLYGKQQRIDLWWSGDAGSLPFNIAIVRFVTAADEWRRAELRFFILNHDSAVTDSLLKTTTLALQHARVEAQVKVIDTTVEARPAEEWIEHYSGHADLTVVGLPHLPVTAARVVELERLARRIGSVLFVRASSQFESGFAWRNASLLNAPPATPAPLDGRDATPGNVVAIQRLALPRLQALADPARTFAEEHAATVQQLCDRSLAPTFDAHGQLLERIQSVVDGLYQELAGALGTRGTRWQQRIFRRGPERVVRSVGEIVNAYLGAEIERTTASAERGVATYLDQLDALHAEVPPRVVVHRAAEDFEAADNDPGWRRRFKARRRFVAPLARHPYRVSVPTGGLLEFYLGFRSLDLARTAIVEAASHTMLVVDDLGRFLNVLKDSLAAIQARALEESLEDDFLEAEAERVRKHIEGLVRSHRGACERQVRAVLRAAHEQAQAFADDLAELHVDGLVSRERRVPPEVRQLASDLEDAPERWAQVQSVWLQRASLIGVVALVQARLQQAVGQAVRTARQAITDGPVVRCRTLLDRLDTVVPELREVDDAAAAPVHEIDLAELPSPEPLEAAAVVDLLQEALATATADVPIEVTVLSEESLQELATNPLVKMELVAVPLRRQLQFVIEGELVSAMQDLIEQVVRAEQRASSTVEDVVRLVRFAQRGGEGEGDLHQAIEVGTARLRAELGRLEELSVVTTETARERLDHVFDLVNGVAVLGTAEAFEAQGRRLGNNDLSRLGRFTERVAAEARQALVTLAYRRTAGVLLARRIGAAEVEVGPVDGVWALVSASTPAPDVLEALPSYYVQLFSGQSALHSAFWVGRENELERIRKGIEHYERGFHGAVVVTGAPGSGKTALCEVAIERFLAGRTVYRVTPPVGGSADPEVFRSCLVAEFQAPPHEASLDEPASVDTVDPLFDALPDGSVILFQNVELWWERALRGRAVLEMLAELVERHGDRLLVFMEMGKSAFRFLERFSAFGSGALARVECGPVDAEVLKEIALLRHHSSGLRFELGGRGEEELSGWGLAQLFSGHFDLSDGNVGAALHGWLAHIEQVDEGTLSIRNPRPPVDDALDALSLPWVAILLQLVLHKQMTVERLLRVTGLPRTELQRDLAALRRTGLVTDGRRDVIELEPRSQHLVVRSLARRGMLP